MARFAPFKSAARASTPGLLQAELDRAQLAQEQQAQTRKDIAGAATLYDKFTGEATPIRDYLTSALRETTPAEAAAIPVEERGMTTGQIDAGVTPLPGGFDLPAPADPAPQFDFTMPDTGLDPTAPTPGGEFDFTMPDTGLDAAELAETGTEVADVAEAGTASGVPLISALRGTDQLARGDIAGAAGTAGKAYLAALGPAGLATALGLGVLGV